MRNVRGGKVVMSKKNLWKIPFIILLLAVPTSLFIWCEQKLPEFSGTYYYKPVDNLYSVSIRKINNKQYLVKGIGDEAIYKRVEDSLIYRKGKEDVRLVYDANLQNFMVYISRSRVGRMYSKRGNVVSFEKQNSMSPIKDSWKKSLKLMR